MAVNHSNNLKKKFQKLNGNRTRNVHGETVRRTLITKGGALTRNIIPIMMRRGSGLERGQRERVFCVGWQSASVVPMSPTPKHVFLAL